jgi:hypothetical protein
MNKPAFEIHLPTGERIEIFESGRVTGVDPSSLVINRIPQTRRS